MTIKKSYFKIYIYTYAITFFASIFLAISIFLVSEIKRYAQFSLKEMYRKIEKPYLLNSMHIFLR